MVEVGVTYYAIILLLFIKFLMNSGKLVIKKES